MESKTTEPTTMAVGSPRKNIYPQPQSLLWEDVRPLHSSVFEIPVRSTPMSLLPRCASINVRSAIDALTGYRCTRLDQLIRLWGLRKSGILRARKMLCLADGPSSVLVTSHTLRPFTFVFGPFAMPLLHITELSFEDLFDYM